MPTSKEVLVMWLQDAYAMEHAAIDILTRQEGRLQSQPILQGKVQDHLRDTKAQAEQVKGLLDRFGETPSTVKKGTGKLIGNVAALTNAAAKDELIKNALADYAFEQFEIAAYTALVAAAEELDEPEVKRTCEQILQQEEEMAAWLAEHLPEVTQTFLGNHVA